MTTTASRRGAAFVGALALIILAGCVSGVSVESVSQSGPPSGPSFAEPSMDFVEPSETEQPSDPPPPPAAAGLTGIWDGTWVIDDYGNTGGFTMDLVQSGDSFSGTVELTNTDCSNGPVEGTLDGSRIDFGWLLTPQPVQFEGTLNGNSMSGTWSANACSDASIALTGTWEGTKRPD
jgi:hypothetical protein